MWPSLAFLYHGANSVSPHFIEAARDFGLRFRALSEHDTQSGIVAKDWDTSLPLPKRIENGDFWITSYTHLRQPWTIGIYPNAETREFKLRSSEVVQADFMRSSSGFYPHARTEQFEAVALGCLEATMILVLPTGEHRIEELEATIAQQPDMVESVLKKSLGDVRLPPFHFSFDANLRNPIEALGVRRIFNDPQGLYLVARKGGVIRGIAQRTEITVDKDGIRTDAGTLGGSTVGGEPGVPLGVIPFHMTLDRPFLFLIRDNTTRALLLAGAVMNPNLQ
jgi:serine protease inhibitor